MNFTWTAQAADGQESPETTFDLCVCTPTLFSILEETPKLIFLRVFLYEEFWICVGSNFLLFKWDLFCRLFSAICGSSKSATIFCDIYVVYLALLWSDDAPEALFGRCFHCVVSPIAFTQLSHSYHHASKPWSLSSSSFHNATFAGFSHQYHCYSSEVDLTIEVTMFIIRGWMTSDVSDSGIRIGQTGC